MTLDHCQHLYETVQPRAWWGWLALTLLKPQLALVPIGYALIHWFIQFRKTKVFPSGALQLLLAASLIFLPAFAIMPDWLTRWQSSPRPLFERAVSGAFPRILLAAGVPPSSLGFWALLALAGLGLLALLRRLAGSLSLELTLVWSFIVSPLVHDYDLVQLILLLDTRRLRLAAIISSIPGWLVILFAYGYDQAWVVYSPIAPAVLWATLWRERQDHDRALPGRGPETAGRTG